MGTMNLYTTMFYTMLLESSQMFGTREKCTEHLQGSMHGVCPIECRPHFFHLAVFDFVAEESRKS